LLRSTNWWDFAINLVGSHWTTAPRGGGYAIPAIRLATVKIWRRASTRVVCSLSVVALALIIPFTPLAPAFGFDIPPTAFFLVLIGLVGTYLLLVEVIKRWFVRRYWYLLEQSRAIKNNLKGHRLNEKHGK